MTLTYLHINEPGRRLSPVEEEDPPPGASYLSAAVVIRRATRAHARVRAKKRPLWWLPWRRGRSA